MTPFYFSIEFGRIMHIFKKKTFHTCPSTCYIQLYLLILLFKTTYFSSSYVSKKFYYFFARCVLCRAKILRLKQHHKGQHGPHRRPPVLQPQELSDDTSVPQSVSNYSFSRLSSSSSNHSFASGLFCFEKYFVKLKFHRGKNPN